MSSPDKLHESAPEGIDIIKLAQELGVEEGHYVYPAGDMEKARAIFEYFRQNIQKNDEDHISVEADATIHISDLLSKLDIAPYFPLFFPRMEGVEFWEKSLFFDLAVTYIVCRGIQLRIKLMEDLRDSGTFLSDPAEFIPRLNDVELFNTFGAIFHKRVQTFLEQQPIFRSLRERMLPLEDWYDEQLSMAERMRVPKKLLVKADRDFWSDRELPVAKLFIANPATYAMDPREFVTYIDRFLCHAGNEYFDLIVGGIKSEKSGYLPRWRSWIYARQDLLLHENGNETQKIFGKIFRIKGKIIEDGKLSEEAKRKLPGLFVETFENIIQSKKRAQKKLRKAVVQISTPQPTQTSMSALLTRPIIPQKEAINFPFTSDIFVGIEDAKSNKKELTHIQLPALSEPLKGAKIMLERSIRGKKNNFLPLELTGLEGKREIPPIGDESIRGNVVYRLSIVPPVTHRFEGQNFIEVSFYIEPKQEKIISHEPQEAPKPQIKGEAGVPAIAQDVQTAVATAIKMVSPQENAETVWGFLLEPDSDTHPQGNILETGVVNFSLPPSWQDGVELKYHTISVSVPANCSPSLGSHIDSILSHRAEEITREESIKRHKQEEQRQLQDFLVKHAHLIQIFEEAAEKMRAEKKGGNGLDGIIAELLAQMKATEWITFSNAQGTQITLRHKGSATIQLRGSSITVTPENGQMLTDIEKTGYHIITERLTDILAIINEKKPQERKNLAKKMSERREAVIVYGEALKRGQARLIVLPPESRTDLTASFPKGKYPLVFGNISHKNIDIRIQELQAEHPTCRIECCLIKDAISINGPTSKIPATLLADSARAIYILRKRVLITLGLLPDTDDPDRAPIDTPKKPKKGQGASQDVSLIQTPLDPLPPENERSPRSILDKLVQSSGGVHAAQDITDDFLGSYLRVLQEKDVFVGYTYPISMTWNSLAHMVETKTTAG